MERTFAAPTAWCLCGSLTNFPHIILPFSNLFNRINSLICIVRSHKICGNAKLIVSNKMRVDMPASPEKNNNSEISVFVCARPDQKQTLLPINSFYTCKDCGLADCINRARENSVQKECDKGLLPRSKRMFVVTSDLRYFSWLAELVLCTTTN